MAKQYHFSAPVPTHETLESKGYTPFSMTNFTHSLGRRPLKRIMQVASVIGREFAFRILQAISGMHEELKSSLLNLQGLEFIYEKSLFPELEYIFKHALTQEVAYNSLLLKRRKEIHEKIGRAIEELYPE
jgi:predicted ATPase